MANSEYEAMVDYFFPAVKNYIDNALASRIHSCSEWSGKNYERKDEDWRAAQRFLKQERYGEAFLRDFTKDFILYSGIRTWGSSDPNMTAVLRKACGNGEGLTSENVKLLGENAQNYSSPGPMDEILGRLVWERLYTPLVRSQKTYLHPCHVNVWC